MLARPLVLLALAAPCLALRGVMRRPPPLPARDVADPETQMFSQVLDHFQPTDDRRWQQR